MRYISLFLLLAFVFSNCAKAQSGCTDPQATNYDPAATINDGSCLYPATNYFPTHITGFPDNLNEPSGLEFFENTIWTHEDGGSGDFIFQIDSLNGNILKSVVLTGADNLDWEELAEDPTHLYVGDFGNNYGNRTNLRIYKIKKSDLSSNAVTPELITFSYSDQTDFTPAQNENDYDCEAFFVHNDSLHLFSKNWVNFKTRHYVLPTTPGDYIAELRDSLEVQGQITAADIAENGEVVLLGYNVVTGNAFLWLLFDYLGNQFFDGNKRKINLGNVLNMSQPEGIAFKKNGLGYIVSERISAFPSRLLSFDIGQWVGKTTATSETFGNTLPISPFPNPFQTSFNLDLTAWQPSFLHINVYDTFGQLIQSKNYTDISSGILQLNLSTIPAGWYWVEMTDGKRVRQAQVLKM